MSRTDSCVEIGGANVVIKFKLLDPETSNVLIVNAETVTEIRMRHSRTTRARITEIGHVQVDVVLRPLAPSLPAGFAAGSSRFRCTGSKYLVRRKLTIIWSN
jgi:hypothetical protein